MTYVLGIILGAALGCVVSLLKYTILWRGYVKDTSGRAEQTLYGRMTASGIINVALLVVIFLLRNHLPCDFFATIIAAALALSLTGKLYSITRLDRQKERNRSDS